MINQVYQILMYYKALKDGGTEDEKTLLSLLPKAGIKFLTDYINGTAA